MKPALCLVVLLISLQLDAQNLVPNAGFEEYKTCPPALSPTGIAYSNYVKNWYAPTDGSSDYFNACAPVNGPWVPQNTVGYQKGFQNSKAYSGFYTYYAGFSYREYIGVDLKSPLQIGDTYLVSVSVSLAEVSGFASGSLGIYFSKGGAVPPHYAQYKNLNVTPQIAYDNYGIISDTADWLTLTRTFVADDAYQRIFIGNFNDDVATPKSTITGSSGTGAYYFIDSVIVVKTSTLINTPSVYISPKFADSLLCAGDTFYVPYHVTSNFYPGNIFTVQLDWLGSFINAFNIGSLAAVSDSTIKCIIPVNMADGNGYRLRIMSSAPYDSSYQSNFTMSVINTITKPIASVSAITCDSIKLSATSSPASFSYYWTGPNGFTSLVKNPAFYNSGPGNSGDYIVFAQTSSCKSVPDTVNLVVPAKPGKPIVTGNTKLCEGDTLAVFGSGVNAGAEFSWSTPLGIIKTHNIIIPQANGTHTGSYILTTILNDCTAADSIDVKVTRMPVPVASNNGPLNVGEKLLLTVSDTVSGNGYNWIGPAHFNSYAQAPIISPVSTMHAGAYIVTVSADGCSASDTTIVEVLADTSYLVLYPNANNGSFTVKGVLEKDQLVPLKVVNAIGQEIWRGTKQTVKKLLEYHIVLPEVADGGYFLSLRIDGKTVAMPFVVKK
jgi:hypothetical protein